MPAFAQGGEPPTAANTAPGQESGSLPIGASCVAELITQGDTPGLYITLENLPQDFAELVVKYTFNDRDGLLLPCDSKSWYAQPDEDDALCPVDENGNARVLCFGVDEYPLSAYLAGDVNTLWVQVSYMREDWLIEAEEFAPVRFSHDKAFQPPQTPPPFTADFKLEWFSYTVVGHFADFPPNVAQVRSAYSWDGVNYQYSGTDGLPMRWSLRNLGNPDADARARLENQECALHFNEPLKSFLARKQDSFYLRLEIVIEDGAVYHSQPARLARTQAEPMPGNLIPRAYMGFDVSVLENRNDKGLSPDDENYYAELVKYTFGQIQLTVGEDATREEIRRLLPDTVPVRVRFWDRDSDTKIAYGDVDCKVKWKPLPALSLTPGQPLTLADMAEPLVIPAGTQIKTDLGAYTLTAPLTFRSRYNTDDIRLILNPVAAGEEPRAGLKTGIDWDGNEVMSLAFWQKPSGASSIKVYTVVDGKRALLCELLDRRKVDHNQSHALYGYVPLLDEDALRDMPDQFAIQLEIEGGVYGGRTVTLPWPQEYDLPTEIYDPSGTEGQENNAGTDHGDGDSNEDGQRPGLPQEPETSRPDAPESKPPASSTPPPAPQPPAVPTAPVVQVQAPGVGPSSPASSAPASQEEPQDAAPPPSEPPPDTPQEPVGEQALARQQEAEKRSVLPVVAMAAVVLVGGSIAVAAGAGGSAGAKLLAALRKLFTR